MGGAKKHGADIGSIGCEAKKLGKSRLHLETKKNTGRVGIALKMRCMSCLTKKGLLTKLIMAMLVHFYEFAHYTLDGFRW